jgi:polyprenyl P-hydroxybenzoate/phenylacrylic acid decarboxylase-like protein
MGGVLDVRLTTTFRYTDGCDWVSTQRITGDPRAPTLQYDYQEAIAPGQRGCATACGATATVSVRALLSIPYSFVRARGVPATWAGAYAAALAELGVAADAAPDVADGAASGGGGGGAPAWALVSEAELAAVVTADDATLLTRAADVTLKERRPLVLMVRETPFHLGHLRTMTALAEMGATIAPPLPALYARPESILEMVDQSVGRTLDLFGLDWSAVRRWDGLK